ncbi:MAG: hypothetical protein AzoDbin1_02156 [Azoarcus sp.]|nr:hypothetical protein [Azoarcus sp.]
MLTEQKRAGEFLIAEGNGSISREKVVVASGSGALVPGTVLGKVTLGAATVVFAGTGNGALSMDATTPILAGALAGDYIATCVTAAANGGTFRVEDPNGNVLGDVAVGATFADDLKFVISDGATDFIVGDKFTITVAAGSGKYVPYADAATNGSGAAAGILYAEVDATLADASAVIIARHAEVDEALLTGINAAGKADLAALQIIVR